MQFSSDQFRSRPISVLRRMDAGTHRLGSVFVDNVECMYVNDSKLISAIMVDN